MVDQKEQASEERGDAFYAPKSTWETLIECKSCEISLFGKETMGVVYEHDGLKCYPPWDEIIRSILEKGEEDPDLEIAYGRIGESIEDVDLRDTGSSLQVYLDRSLSPPFSSL